MDKTFYFKRDEEINDDLLNKMNLLIEKNQIQNREQAVIPFGIECYF